MIVCSLGTGFFGGWEATLAQEVTAVWPDQKNKHINLTDVIDIALYLPKGCLQGHSPTW